MRRGGAARTRPRQMPCGVRARCGGAWRASRFRRPHWANAGSWRRQDTVPDARRDRHRGADGAAYRAGGRLPDPGLHRHAPGRATTPSPVVGRCRPGAPVAWVTSARRCPDPVAASAAPLPALRTGIVPRDRPRTRSRCPIRGPLYPARVAWYLRRRAARRHPCRRAARPGPARRQAVGVARRHRPARRVAWVARVARTRARVPVAAAARMAPVARFRLSDASAAGAPSRSPGGLETVGSSWCSAQIRCAGQAV